jgi:hypothetical protein
MPRHEWRGAILCAQGLQLIGADRIVSLLLPALTDYGAASPGDQYAGQAVCAEIDGGNRGRHPYPGEAGRLRQITGRGGAGGPGEHAQHGSQRRSCGCRAGVRVRGTGRGRVLAMGRGQSAAHGVAAEQPVRRSSRDLEEVTTCVTRLAAGCRASYRAVGRHEPGAAGSPGNHPGTGQGVGGYLGTCRSG